MPAVKLSINIAVNGGPTLAVNSTENVEAYDVIEVTVPADAKRTVQLQPAVAASVNLLLIQSDLYGSEITYTATDGNSDSKTVDLLGPQLFGRGVLALFGTEMLSLKLANSHPVPAAGAPSRDAHVQILVGRRATV